MQREDEYGRTLAYLYLDDGVTMVQEEILRAGGAIKISELAKKAGFTERYISQIFGRHIGLSPKTYAEIIRLQTSLGNVLAADGQKGQSSKKSLLEIAVEENRIRRDQVSALLAFRDNPSDESWITGSSAAK